MATSANSISFSFNNFSANQLDLELRGDATTGNNNVLQLNLFEKNRVGQALFTAPVQLWDNSSATVASFDTTFTFVISKSDQGDPGDGFTFFMTSVFDNGIPEKSDGMYLGLFGPNGSRADVVAVEFDTFSNPEVGDPPYAHIGIDVHSIRSQATAQWNWKKGEVATARVSYDPSSKRLTVTTSYPGGNPVTLSHEVELKSVLPEWVKVGFSASTGDVATQITTIRSWSFTSTLREDEGN